MTQQERVFPVGNGADVSGARRGNRRDGMNFDAELRELARTMGPQDAELLDLAADRLKTLLAETDRLSLLLDAAERLGGVVVESTEKGG